MDELGGWQLNRRIVVASLALLAGLALWQLGQRENPPARTVEPLRLAVSPQIMSALVYIAADRGYFRDEGVDVTIQTYPFGKDCLAKVVTGEADIATVAEVPVMRALVEKRPVSVFATIQSTDKDVAVIARTDSGIRTPADLAGKRIGLVAGTNHEYYLGLILAINQIDPSAVTIVPVTMDNGADALISGRIDALSSWITARLIIRAAMPEKTVSFASEGIYTELWTLAIRSDALAERSEALRRLLRALIRAEAFAAESRAQAVAIVAPRVGLSVEMADSIWDDIGLRVGMDQSLVLHMEGEARRELQGKPDARIPDFLNSISVKDLTAIEPGRVTITVP